MMAHKGDHVTTTGRSEETSAADANLAEIARLRGELRTMAAALQQAEADAARRFLAGVADPGALTVALTRYEETRK